MMSGASAGRAAKLIPYRKRASNPSVLIFGNNESANISVYAGLVMFPRERRSSQIYERGASFVYFRPINSYVVRCRYANSDTISFYGNNGNADIVIDDDLFTRSSRKD
jgi:hypothetical protein